MEEQVDYNYHQEKPKGYYGAFDSRNYQYSEENWKDGTLIDNYIGDFFVGLWNDITGKSDQTYSFEQQEYIQDKEREYDKPVNEMARQEEAGIPSYFSAQGIAQYGSGSESAPSVAINPVGAANGLNALSDAYSRVASLDSQIDLNRSQAHKTDVDASQTETLTPLLDSWYRQDTFLKLSEILKNKGQARALEIENKYRGQGLLLDLEAKRLQLPIMRQTFRNLQKEYDFKQKEIDHIEQQIKESESNISLNEKRELLLEAETKGYELGNWYQNRMNQFIRDFNCDPRWASNSILFGLATDLNKTDEEVYTNVDNFCQLLYNQEYALNEARWLWKQKEMDKSFNLEKGLVKERAKADVTSHAGKKLFDTANKYASGTGFSVGVGPFNITNNNP